MGTLDEHLDEMRHQGILFAEKGKLACPAFRAAMEEHGRFAARRLAGECLEDMLKATEQHAVYSEDRDLTQKVEDLRKKYAAGERFLIEDVPFYNPSALEKENPFLTAPIMNNVGNTVAMASMPLAITGRYTPYKFLGKIAAGTLAAGSAVKLFIKAYKEWQKEKRDLSKVVRYSMAGVGGVIVATGVTLTDGPLKKYLFNPLMAAYAGTAMGVKDLFTKRGTSLHQPLPSLAVIRSDIKEQCRRHADALSAYAGEEQFALPEEEIQPLLQEVNVFLKHALTALKPREIDIEVDYIFTPTISALEDAPSFGNRSTRTVEFSGRAMRSLTPAEVAHTYAMSALFLDGEQNPGWIRHRADAVLEDLAVYHEGKGYDLLLEQTRLESVAFTYADMRRQELKGKLSKDEALERVGTELSGLGVPKDIIDTIEERLYPDKVREAMAFFQRLTGNTDVYGHTVHYRLMKAKKLL